MLLQVSKNVNLPFYFLRTGIKISHSMPSQNFTSDGSSNLCFKCSKMQLFEPMCESTHCRGEEWSVFGDWFSSFLGRQLANKWLCATQNWLFRVVLVVRLRHVLFFRKNRRSFAWKCYVASNFYWIWLILKNTYSRLPFTFGLIRVNPRFITMS